MSTNISSRTELNAMAIATAFHHTFRDVTEFHDDILPRLVLTEIAMATECIFGVIPKADEEIIRELAITPQQLKEARDCCVRNGLLDYMPGVPALYRLLIPAASRDTFWANVRDQLNRIPR